jgi:hypothetical protein
VGIRTALDALSIVLGTVGSCEMLLRLHMGARLGRLRQVVGKALHVLRSSGVSDHWKGLVARRYAAEVSVSTVFLVLSLIAALAPLSAALWIVSGSADAMWRLMVRLDLIIALAGVSAGYLFVRTRSSTRG